MTSGWPPRSGCATARRAARCTRGHCSRSSRRGMGPRSCSRCPRRGRSARLVAGPVRGLRGRDPPTGRRGRRAPARTARCRWPPRSRRSRRRWRRVEEAVRLDLLRADESTAPWTLSFSHPLVRAAVLRRASARRAATQLHTAAARLVADEAEALRHRVAADRRAGRGAGRRPGPVRRCRGAAARRGRARRRTWWRPAGSARTTRRAQRRLLQARDLVAVPRRRRDRRHVRRRRRHVRPGSAARCGARLAGDGGRRSRRPRSGC